MLSEDFSLKFSGFEPTEEIKKMAHKILGEIYQKSPSQSFLKATFTMTGDIFEGVIDVTSTAGHFVAKAVDKDILGVGAKVLDGIRGELDRWKRKRIL